MGTSFHPMKAVLIFFLAIFSLAAQENTVLLRGIDHISLSRQGYVFAASEKGEVFMLDSLGKMQQNFSPRKPARIHLLEAWNGLRIFAFNRDFQNYFLLDRFLLSDGPVSLERDRGYARLLAPSQDGNLWLLDEAAFELRKLEMNSGRVLFSTPLDLILPRRNYDFSFMREYQNQLYLADRNGPMLVFDLNGTYRKQLPLENCGWFGFDGEEMITTAQGEIIRYHPFKLAMRKQPLPESLKEATEILFLNGRWWVLVKGELILAGNGK